MLKLLVIMAVASLVSSNDIVEQHLRGSVSLDFGFEFDIVGDNPSHYGPPSGGCQSDENAGKITGLDGSGCFPKCDASGACTTDVPSGATAKGECILQGQDGTKYCVLVCSGMDTGTCPTDAKCEPIQGQGVCLYPDGTFATAADLELIPKVRLPSYVSYAFEGFKAKFGKVYEDAAEHEYRLGVFYANLQFIEDFERSGPHSFTLGIGPFTDLTNKEFAAKYTGGVREKKEQLNVVELDTSNLLAGKDWRDDGAVTPVKNQAQCGSCWAFSAVAAMEGAYFQKNSQLKSFSEQQLVDCSTSYGNHGCQGGLMEYAFEYAETHMMDLEGDYGYTAKNGVCHSADYQGVFETSSYVDVKRNSQSQLQAAVDGRVTSVAIEADKSVFQHYTGGVLNSSACGTKLDHGVTAVGYTSDAWIVKNSWGSSWGEDGYVRIAKNDANICGILSQPTYPVL